MRETLPGGVLYGYAKTWTAILILIFVGRQGFSLISIA